jgi:transposase-like protein
MIKKIFRPLSETDISAFSQILTKIPVQTALNDELDDYLCHDKDQQPDLGNSSNGTPSKK